MLLEEPEEQPFDGDKADGEDQLLARGQGLRHTAEQGVGGEGETDELAGHVDEHRVHADDREGKAEPTPAEDVHQCVEGREQQETPAAGPEDEGARPEVLVDREGVVPQAADGEAEQAAEREAPGLAPGGDLLVRLLEPESGEDAEQGGRDRRNRREEAFGVVDGPVQLAGDQQPVDVAGEVALDREVARGEARRRSRRHDDVVSDEQAAQPPPEPAEPLRVVEEDELGEHAGETDAPEHAAEAHLIEALPLEPIVVDDPEEDEEQPAAYDLRDGRLAVGGSQPMPQREGRGNAREEEEQGEDEVVGLETMPRDVLQLAGDRGDPGPAGEGEQRMHDAFAAEDPEQVEAAQGVERKQTLGLRGRGVHKAEVGERLAPVETKTTGQVALRPRLHPPSPVLLIPTSFCSLFCIPSIQPSVLDSELDSALSLSCPPSPS